MAQENSIKIGVQLFTKVERYRESLVISQFIFVYQSYNVARSNCETKKGID